MDVKYTCLSVISILKKIKKLFNMLKENQILYFARLTFQRKLCVSCMYTTCSFIALHTKSRKQLDNTSVNKQQQEPVRIFFVHSQTTTIEITTFRIIIDK